MICTSVNRHSLVLVYRRHWWRLFRKTIYMRCWNCDLRIQDPGRVRS